MSTTTPNDNKQTGRTISDLIAEYPKMALSVIIIFALLIVFLVFMNYSIKSALISLEKNTEQNLPAKDSTKYNVPKENASDVQPPASVKKDVDQVPKKPKEQLKQPVVASINPGTTINVTSHDQKGGITANEVNIGSIPRQIDLDYSNYLFENLKDKSEPIEVMCLLGDAEGCQFAIKVYKFLISNGFNNVKQRSPIILAGGAIGTVIERDSVSAYLLIGGNPQLK